mgnify:CR=1 FL=1
MRLILSVDQGLAAFVLALGAGLGWTLGRRVMAHLCSLLRIG